MPNQTPEKQIGSADALTILGIDKSTLSRWVAFGKLTKVTKVSGVYLYDRTEVEALAASRAAEASADKAASA